MNQRMRNYFYDVHKQWCSLRDTQVYAVYLLGKVKDLRKPT